MAENGQAQKKKANKPLIVGLCVGAVLLALALVVGLLFGSELVALSTLAQIEGTDAYTMEYKGDYGLDEFLRQGASSDGEVVAFVSTYFLHGIPLEFELPDFGCSAFAAQTPEGDAITGRNFDFDDTPILILKTTPQNGYASISTVDLDYLGFHDGHTPANAGLLDQAVLLASVYAPMDDINEKGLSISVLQIMDKPTSQNTGKPGITTSTVVRMVLDKAATVEQATALMAQYDMHSSAGSNYHFLLTDETGASAVVEYIEDELVVLDTTHITNYLIAPGQHSDAGEGYDRYDTITAALQTSGGVMTESQAMEVLRDVVLDQDSISTQWSVVFNNTQKTASYCFKMDFGESFVIPLLEATNP